MRPTTRTGGGRLLMLGMLAAAGAWALYANLGPGARGMDMGARVTASGAPFPVTLGPVEHGAIRGTVVYTGSVAPFSEEDIYPRVTGRIVEMPVYPGDAVRPGQVLARLDSVELTSKVGEAEAGLVASRANRAQAAQEVAAVVAEAGYARAAADRTARLFRLELVSRQDLERDSAQAVAAEAKVDAARAKLEAMSAMRAQSEAALATATIVRDYASIVASAPGFVVKRFVAPGVLVQPGTAVLKVTQIDKVRLQANVGEKDLGSIRTGSPVQVTTIATGSPPTMATVTAVFPFVDQGSRTAVVEALVDNAARRFLPGQYVTMRFVVGDRSAALTVPASALVRIGDKATVWVVKDGHVEPRVVVTGLQNPERVEIAEGLTANERVVVRGQEGLYAGARIGEAAGSAPLQPDVPAGRPETPEMKDQDGGAGHATGGAHAGH